MKKLIDSTFVGGNSEKLKVSMTALQNGASGAAMQKALTTIETVRGLPAGAGLTQYKKTIAKQKARVAYYVAMKKKKKKKVNLKKDHPSPNLDTSKHGEFMGSNAQLRFGKILGDVFGLDAVFGSLISPSGGMAGPGNERIPFIEDGGAVATHGAVHDAAGYLYNCHGIGPGYDYLQSEVGSDPSNPLAGQTNIKWWIKEYKKRGKSVGRFEKLLNSKAYIGAAFAKRYKVLNLAQKKKALKVICETNTAMLKIAGITNTDRVAKVKQLMKVSNAGEKKQLANYYYNNDTFGSFLAAGKLKRIMKPNVSPSVYKKYVDRIMDKNKSRGLYF